MKCFNIFLFGKYFVSSPLLWTLPGPSLIWTRKYQAVLTCSESFYGQVPGECIKCGMAKGEVWEKRQGQYRAV